LETSSAPLLEPSCTISTGWPSLRQGNADGFFGGGASEKPLAEVDSLLGEDDLGKGDCFFGEGDPDN
jgi:hypothetical protein